MMLHPITLESLCRAVVHMDWKCDGDGALRIHEAIAIVRVDVQIIGDDRELIAGHLKYVVVINIHKSAPRTLDYPGGECRWYLGAVLAGRQMQDSANSAARERAGISCHSERSRGISHYSRRANGKRCLDFARHDRTRRCRHLKRTLWRLIFANKGKYF